MRTRNRQLNWTQTACIRGALRLAPRSAGVYAFGEVVRARGLPTDTRWMYIGRTTAGGLRRRLGQHLARVERNPALRDWLAKRNPDREVWFAPTSTFEDAVAVEKQLIRDLDPPFNTVGRKKGGDDGN